LEIGNAAELRAAEVYCFMDEPGIKKALAPAQFEAFKKACETDCESVGKVSHVQLHFEEESPHEFTVTNVRSGKVASFRYDPDVPCIHFNTPSGTGQIGFHVSPDGKMLQFVLAGLPKFARELVFRFFQTITK
jgi:hypothetical protein